MMINVIGAGLAGSIVSTHLRREGFKVRVIDDADKKAGSPPSDNLFTPSWVTRFDRGKVDTGFRLLQELYGPKIVHPFASGIKDAPKVKQIPVQAVLVKPDVVGKVEQLTGEGVRVLLSGKGTMKTFDGPTIICAGYRAPELAPIGLYGHGSSLKVWARIGHCYLFEGRLAPGQSRLGMWAPYRHEKLYQYDEDTVYYADTVALLIDEYEKRAQEVQALTLRHARQHVGDMRVKKMMIGYRPIVEHHEFGYCGEDHPNIWHVNGGGKNGLVVYGWCAAQVCAEFKMKDKPKP